MTSFLALRASVCAYLWCLIPPVFIIFIFYFLCYIGCPPAFPIIYSAYLGPTAARRPSGCRIESAAMTLIIFFHLKRAQFCSRCLLRFDPAFSGSRLVRCPFSSRESCIIVRCCVGAVRILVSLAPSRGGVLQLRGNLVHGTNPRRVFFSSE